MEGRRLVFFGVLPRDEEYCESKQQEAYLLRKKGLSFEQIGEVLEINRSTAYGYWRREAMKLILSGQRDADGC